MASQDQDSVVNAEDRKQGVSRLSSPLTANHDEVNSPALVYRLTERAFNRKERAIRSCLRLCDPPGARSLPPSHLRCIPEFSE